MPMEPIVTFSLNYFVHFDLFITGEHAQSHQYIYIYLNESNITEQ